MINLLSRARTWMTEPRDTRTSIRNLSVLLFLLFGFAYALFTQDTSSYNTLCRAAMTANMVQNGRIDINDYEHLTQDKADFGGNYYCDKGPGLSVLAAPVAFMFTRAFEVSGETPYNRVWSAFLYLCALTTSGLLTALAGVLLFRHIFARTNNLNAALVSALAFALAGPVWGWATSFYSHSATAALLVLGYIAFDEACRRDETRTRFAILAGLAFGGATSTEYTAVVACLIIGVALGLPLLRSRLVEGVRLYAWTAAGALLALLPVFIFHTIAFGSPFETGYAHTSIYTLHDTGIVGVGLPQPDILLKLLISPERGVIWYAPIILATLWAAGRALGEGTTRAIAAATFLVALFYLFMNAGFAYWQGGASTGPRYLTPAIGFSAIVLGLAWPRLGRREQLVSLVLLGLGIAIALACTAVGMVAGGPRILPALLQGEMHATLTYMATNRASLLHLAPPLLVGMVIGWFILNERRLFQST
jgi:hypothetical protein